MIVRIVARQITAGESSSAGLHRDTTHRHGHRRAYVESGELSAVVELRRQFPGIAYRHRSGRTLMLRTV